MRKILYTDKDELLQPLKQLVLKQEHKTLIAWCFMHVNEYLDIINSRYPNEKRPQVANDKVRLWARGDIKMPEAKRAILDAHQAASLLSQDIVIEAYIRAVAQGLSTVHTPKHALGIVYYGLTALANETNIKNRTAVIDEKVKRFYETLLYWQTNTDQFYDKWAPFIIKK